MLLLATIVYVITWGEVTTNIEGEPLASPIHYNLYVGAYKFATAATTTWSANVEDGCYEVHVTAEYTDESGESEPSAAVPLCPDNFSVVPQPGTPENLEIDP